MQFVTDAVSGNFLPVSSGQSKKIVAGYNDCITRGNSQGESVKGPPLWSSGQSFWLQTQRSRVRSPALPDFLSSSGSGTGSTQPREVKLRSYLNKKVAAPGSEHRD